MREILTSKNQFNYSIKQIIIDYEKKTFCVYFGCQCRIAKKNSTTRGIDRKIIELLDAGFICEN